MSIDEDVDTAKIFRMSPGARAETRVLADRCGVTVDEILVEALSWGRAVVEARLAGQRILVERRGRVRELVLDEAPGELERPAR